MKLMSYATVDSVYIGSAYGRAGSLMLESGLAFAECKDKYLNGLIKISRFEFYSVGECEYG